MWSARTTGDVIYFLLVHLLVVLGQIPFQKVLLCVQGYVHVACLSVRHVPRLQRADCLEQGFYLGWGLGHSKSSLNPFKQVELFDWDCSLLAVTAEVPQQLVSVAVPADSRYQRHPLFCQSWQ